MKPIQYDAVRAAELAHIFERWLTGNRVEREHASNDLRQAGVKVVSLPNPRFITARTHGRGYTFDANGLQWKDLLWVDLETGEAEQALLDANGHKYILGDRLATQLIKLVTPIVFKPAGEVEN